jgi:predicted component of viral defense system (DUF524 family)
MDSTCFEALQIPLGGGFTLLLEDDSPLAATGAPVACATLPEDWAGSTSPRAITAPKPGDRPPFCYDASAPERGLSALRIFELREYVWQITAPADKRATDVHLNSSLQQSKDNKDLWKPKKGSGRFRFVNYLGSAWIEATVSGHPPVRITFDVASPKLDYEQEYRSMVESIGGECQQLLLEWGTPTTLNLTPDPAKRVQTLLEQFLFLRHVLGPGKLELYLEVLQRNPHSRLEIERNWKPAGSADPAAFARDPMRNGRGWSRVAGQLLPEEIREERKFTSADTPPNRFVKFALQSFRNTCDEVLNAQSNGKPAWAEGDTVCLEATSLQHTLDAFLALPLFDEVGELQRIPFESTTLQRREGYREILLAWLMLDAAAQIDWPGREDAYDGTNRDVATLYEYWLYFLLVRAFQENLGMVADRDPLAADGALPFCCHAGDGRLLINLKQREASFCRFRWKKDSRALRVHFFYNRSFGRKSVGERGTYSKTFRPDYTLVIIPEEFDNTNWYEAERAAEKAGRIAYLHFDAKYRGENLPGIFGTADTEEEDGEDGRAKASGTVKNADLYKMHTYNEAIRRTVGSYVLYPGVAPTPEAANARFERYHELIPGIGAFALRPKQDGLAPDGLPSVCGFIQDILTHQLDRFTQSYGISMATEGIIREKPAEYMREDHVIETVSLPGAAAVLGYMKHEDAAIFQAGNTLTGPFFYCRATGDDGAPLTLDISAAQGAFLIGWSGSRTGPFSTVSWMARIISCRLVTGEIVKKETGRDPSDVTRHYLLFKLTDVSPMEPRDITGLVLAANGSGKGGKYRAFQTTAAEILKQKLPAVEAV